MFTQLIWRVLNHYSVSRDRVSPGQGLVEYALILVFVAVVMVIILSLLGPGISNIYSNILKVFQGQ